MVIYARPTFCCVCGHNSLSIYLNLRLRWCLGSASPAKWHHQVTKCPKCVVRCHPSICCWRLRIETWHLRAPYMICIFLYGAWCVCGYHADHMPFLNFSSNILRRAERSPSSRRSNGVVSLRLCGFCVGRYSSPESWGDAARRGTPSNMKWMLTLCEDDILIKIKIKTRFVCVRKILYSIRVSVFCVLARLRRMV